ncbi:cytoplasmic dynein 2 light intermediate chain 1 [Biomphalaria glabrata]|nr:cytoplasmic dynein 2 light intermediate chain 1 [Biomphalaria glabrata]
MDKSLWDLAIEQNEIKKDENFSSEESTVIVMGSKSSGKTSIILRFLDRDEPPKPTVALEYTFGRRSKGHNIGKDVGHIWELGGGTWLSKLLDIPITPDALLQTTLILVLDLATPTELWNTMETLLQVARSRLNEAIKEAKATDPQIENKLRKQTWERIGEEHPDKNLMNPFLIPLAIVGSKYDIFQDFDSDKRKTICKTLRFLAHIHGASLQFFSTKQEQLVSRMKGVLSFYLFDTTVSKTIQVDHNKPIFVSAGQDALQQIGTPPLNDGDVGKVQARNPMELWKMAYTSHFPQTYVNNPSTVDDPAKDPQFAEPAIDTLRAQKQEELERYRKLAERRSKGTYDNDYVAA